MFGGKGFSFGAPTTSASTGATTGATTGFNFGTQQPPLPATASPSTGFTLGGTPAAGAGQPGGFKLGMAPATGAATGFGFGATSTPITAASTGAPGFGGFSQPAATGFGQATTSAPASTSAPGFTGFGGFGATPASTATTTASFSLGGAGTATTTAAGNTVLSGLLGTPKTTTTTAPVLGLGGTTQAATTSASAFTGFKVGGTPAGTATAGFAFSKPGTATTTATTSVAPMPSAGFGFGTAPPATSSTAASSVPAAGGFNFGATATSTASTTATGASLGTASTVPGTQMTYRQLEDQINKWMGELESQEKIFLQQATQVNAWDRLLVDNGEKITQLNGDMERVKVDQGKLEQELEFIKSQQRELEDLIIPLEKTMDQLPSSSLQPHADLERENTYQLADNIDAQLKRMVQDLKEIIDHLNMSSSAQDTNDPILQITKILNAHMDSLQWIDNNSALLGRRVEDISKQMENQKKDQERNFRLVYD